MVLWGGVDWGKEYGATVCGDIVGFLDESS